MNETKRDFDKMLREREEMFKQMNKRIDFILKRGWLVRWSEWKKA